MKKITALLICPFQAESRTSNFLALYFLNFSERNKKKYNRNICPLLFAGDVWRCYGAVEVFCLFVCKKIQMINNLKQTKSKKKEMSAPGRARTCSIQLRRLALFHWATRALLFYFSLFFPLFIFQFQLLALFDFTWFFNITGFLNYFCHYFYRWCLILLLSIYLFFSI